MIRSSPCLPSVATVNKHDAWRYNLDPRDPDYPYEEEADSQEEDDEPYESEDDKWVDNKDFDSGP